VPQKTRLEPSASGAPPSARAEKDVGAPGAEKSED
jgi:hypothetical protein